MLAVVAEQTGYPPDLLDLDLDLEADLGIDTVKQAEVFATIREAYGIERDDSLKLRDYPTLNHVVGVRQRARPGAAAAAERRRSRPSPPRPSAAAPGAAEAEGFPRRVPVPVVRPPLDRCVATGVELGEGSRVVLMPDRGGVGEALAKRLAKLGVEVLEIDGAPDAEELERRLEMEAAGPIQGVYWLPALDDEGAARGARARRLARGAARAREAAGDRDARARRPGRGEGTFLVAATRLGGRHGYDAAGATSVDGRRRDRLRQGARPRARGRAGEGGRLRRRAARPPRSPTA